MEEKNWGKVKEKLPKGWKMQGERTRKEKRMIVGIKKELAEQGEGKEMKEEGLIEGKIME